MNNDADLLPIVITGYARVGKTTALNLCFKKLGYTPQSSSIILHNAAQAILHIMGDSVEREDKNHVLKCGITYRNFLINLAEKVIVPKLGGRNAFVGSMEVGHSFVYELFNVEEYEILCSRFEKRGLAKPKVISIRGEKEQPDIDDRQIIDYDYEITNNYESIEEYVSELKEMVDIINS